MNRIARTATALTVVAATTAGGMLGAAPVTAQARTAPPVTTASRVGYSGVGAYQLGTSVATLRARKAVVPGPCENSWQSTEQARKLGVWVEFDRNRVSSVVISKPTLRTWSGARVGMTMAQVQRIYGKQFHYVMKKQEVSSPMRVGRIHNGSREIIFIPKDYRSARPSSVVGTMIARTTVDYLPYETC